MLKKVTCLTITFFSITIILSPIIAADRERLLENGDNVWEGNNQFTKNYKNQENISSQPIPFEYADAPALSKMNTIRISLETQSDAIKKAWCPVLEIINFDTKEIIGKPGAEKNGRISIIDQYPVPTTLRFLSLGLKINDMVEPCKVQQKDKATFGIKVPMTQQTDSGVVKPLKAIRIELLISQIGSTSQFPLRGSMMFRYSNKPVPPLHTVIGKYLAPTNSFANDELLLQEIIKISKQRGYILDKPREEEYVDVRKEKNKKYQKNKEGYEENYGFDLTNSQICIIGEYIKEAKKKHGITTIKGSDMKEKLINFLVVYNVFSSNKKDAVREFLGF